MKQRISITNLMYRLYSVIQAAAIICLVLSACAPIPANEIAFQAYTTAVPLLEAHDTASAPTQPEPLPVFATLAPQSTPIPAAASSPTPLPLAASQVIRVAAVLPEKIEPLHMEGENMIIASALFPGLMRMDEKTLQILPGVAESWQVSEDGLTWTFYLQENLPWVAYNPATRQVAPLMDESGNVHLVSAADFVLGLERFLAASEDFPYQQVRSLLEEGTPPADGNTKPPIRAKAVNNQILVVEFNQPHTWLDMLFDLPVFSASPTWNTSREPLPPTYGPFAIKSWDPGISLILAANPHWVNTPAVPMATLQSIEFYNIYLLDPLESFKNEQLNLAWLDSAKTRKALADPDISQKIISQNTNCLTYIAYDTSALPFNNALVRLAFSLAVNSQQVLEAVGESASEPPSFFPEWVRDAPEGKDFPDVALPYQPERARAILNTYFSDRSIMPEITLAVPNDQLSKQISQSLIQQWEQELKVKVTLKTLSRNDNLNAAQSHPLPQVWLGKYCPNLPDSIYLLEGWTDRSQNLSAWSDETFTNLLQQAKAETDPLRRKEMVLLLQDILTREAAVLLPLYWNQQSSLSDPLLMRSAADLVFLERMEKWGMLNP